MSKVLSRWFYPKIDKQYIDEVKKIIDSNFVNEGPYSKKFEIKLASICKNRHYFFTNWNANINI